MAQNASQGKKTVYYIPVKVIGGSTENVCFGKLVAYTSSNKILASKVLYREAIKEYETTEYIEITLPTVTESVRFRLDAYIDDLEYIINDYGFHGNTGEVHNYVEINTEFLEEITVVEGVTEIPVTYIWYNPIKQYQIPIPTENRSQFTIGECGFVGDIQIGSYNNNSEDEDTYTPLVIYPAGNNTTYMMIPQEEEKFGNLETLPDALPYETWEGEQVENNKGWRFIADIEPTQGSAHLEGYVVYMTNGFSTGDITWS